VPKVNLRAGGGEGKGRKRIIALLSLWRGLLGIAGIQVRGHEKCSKGEEKKKFVKLLEWLHRSKAGIRKKGLLFGYSLIKRVG